ncbi:MAG: PAS domain S-box protein [Telmatospirillum sp.]|nr:PAS domain S-box protein [Telmatospirillum sp.]
MTDDLSDGIRVAILEQAADAIIFADHKGTILLWNSAAERLFGFTAEQVLGQSLDVFIPERLRAPHWSGYHAAMERGRTRLEGRPTVTKALHSSGDTVYVSMSFAVVTAPTRGVVGSVAIARAAARPAR